MKRLVLIALSIAAVFACAVLLIYRRTTRTDWYIPQGYRGWVCLVYDGEAGSWHFPRNNSYSISNNGLAFARWYKNSVWTQNHFWTQGPNGQEAMSQEPTSPNQVGIWGMEILTFPGDLRLNGRVAEMYFVGTRTEFKTEMDRVTTDPKALPDFQFLDSRRERIVQRQP